MKRDYVLFSGLDENVARKEFEDEYNLRKGEYDVLVGVNLNPLVHLRAHAI